MALKAYKYRIYPDKEQKVFLERHFGSCRFVYNHFLAMVSNSYKTEKKSISGFQCKRMLVSLKKDYPWLKDINSQSLQQSVINLDMAYKRFFKRLGEYPQFKKKIGRQSFSVPQNFRIEGNKLFIPKLKTDIKIKLHSSLDGDIKTLTISKEPSGKYYISVSCEVVVQPLPSVQQKIGVDLGITHFAALSTGEKIEHPKSLRKSEKRLISLQRQLFRKQKGSNNRNKARLKVATLHEKIKSQRKDFLHKLSRRLISENQVICLETLNVKGMVRNRHLAKAISDSGWGEFTRQIQYKADWYGRTLKQIPMFYPSSKKCNICHFVMAELKLSQRMWTCPNCGAIHDRDDNASNVIKTVGQDMPEVTPAERRTTTILSMKAIQQVRSMKQDPMHGVLIP